MDFTCIFLGILFTLAGLWFAFGKGYLHLSLWKNMPQKEKDKLRIIPLCRNIGGIITLNGIIFLVKGFLPLFSSHWFVSAMIAWMILAGLDIWYIEKSNRYHRP